VAVEAEALSVIKGLVEVEGWDAVLPKGEARTEIAAGKLVAPPEPSCGADAASTRHPPKPGRFRFVAAGAMVDAFWHPRVYPRPAA